MTVTRMLSVRQALSVLVLAGLSYAQASDPAGNPALSVTHVQNSTVVPLYEVFEIAFPHQAQYENPFFDVTVDVILISPSSKQVRIGGFHYQPGLWKARFAPGELGRWTYRFAFQNARGQTASGDGAFTCVKGRKPNPGFLRRHPENPYRFVFDDGTPYFPIGVQDCWGDNNHNDSVLDVFSMEGPFRTDLKEPPILPPGPMFVRGPSSNPQNADVFFRSFGQCGFNLYRFSQKNCSYDLYRDLDHYLAPEGIMTDELLQAARRYGFRNFYGLFGYQKVFNNEPNNTEGLAKVKRFIKYSVDRWVRTWTSGNSSTSSTPTTAGTRPWSRTSGPSTPIIIRSPRVGNGPISTGSKSMPRTGTSARTS